MEQYSSIFPTLFDLIRIEKNFNISNDKITLIPISKFFQGLNKFTFSSSSPYEAFIIKHLNTEYVALSSKLLICT